MTPTPPTDLPSHCYSLEWRTRKRSFWQWLLRAPVEVYSVKVLNSAGLTYLMNRTYTPALVRDLATRPHPMMRAFDA